jgi:putative DNA primase/helicase
MPDDVRKLIENAPEFTPPTADHNDNGKGRKPNARQQVIAVGISAKLLWRDDEHAAFATVEVEGHLEHFAIRSTAFRRWLLREYGTRFPSIAPDGKSFIPGAPSNNALAEGLNAIEAAACAGPELVPAIRVAEHGGKLVLDLGTADWSAVVIGPDDWNVVARPPCPFVRPPGMRPLPVPIKEGSISELRQLLNIGSEADFKLVVAYLVAALKRRGPYPVLVVNGEQGAAKSTFCRVLRRLIDPNAAELRTAPRDERDVLIAARNGWMVGLDNLSFVDGDLSDTICRIATGGGFATRALYSNGEEFMIDVCRPVILNGIPALASRPDLADRAVTLVLPAIPDEARKPEGDFWTAFDTAAPRILGALLDGVSAALQNGSSVKLARLPRMADFAVWAAAAFPAFGWQADDFLSAYAENRMRNVEETVEADSLAGAVRSLAEDRKQGWLGTSTELLVEINGRVGLDVQREKGWPKDGTRLSSRLRRAAPGLRRLGIEVELDVREPKTGRRLVQIKKAASRSTASAWETTI